MDLHLANVSFRMGYRMIEQNEFLDIIVMLDKDSLQVPLQEDSQPIELPPARGWASSTVLAGDRESYLIISRKFRIGGCTFGTACYTSDN